MKKFSISGIIERITHIVRHFGRQNISMHAAGAGYFIILSLFPLLVLVLAMLRYTGLQVETLTDLLEGFLPEALMPAAKRLILSTYRNTSGTLVSVSAITGLWSASRGVYGLLKGLNTVYEAPENRGYFRTRILCAVYTLVFLFLLVATLVLNVFGTTLLSAVDLQNLQLLSFLWELLDRRFILMLLLQTGLFSAMYMALPNRRNTFRESFPGAVLASIGWLGFSDLYSVYVRYFASYANIYGSVYAVALSMLWLYCCISIVFYGGALNHYLAAHRNHFTKEG